ncbi:MAG: amidase [Deltaproteobacteria bacterium]|nr:amidase [Deltaproteobacteria bacterium]
MVGIGLCFTSARELAASIRARAVSAREVMAAFLDQIARVNPKINAIVAKLDDEKCLALADEADRRLSRGDDVGPLHGLPFAFKDIDPAVGFPMTRGSAIFKDFMPSEDSVLVERLRRAGVIPIGKTNVSEFGMGSHTYNEVYGTTLNPYDLKKSTGGSSGGAGAALAAGLLPLASGSDLGGSLRNPANFNNVVALRPSVGLVPSAPVALPFLGFTVKGPMARSVGDAAFLLSAMAGADARDPAVYPSDPSLFARPLDRNFKNARVAWCPDLGGLPLDRRVRAVLDRQRKSFADLGCIVEDAVPDLSGAEEVFLTLRAWNYWHTLGPLLKEHRRAMKPEAVWQIEQGRDLSGADIARAMQLHGELMQRMRRFQEKYEFVICAVNQVPPFDAAIDWPREIEGVKMENYLDWMKSAYLITSIFCPAISVPAGFTEDGLPVGIQIVGRYRDDLGVLQLAHAFEVVTHFGLRRPAIA